MILIFAVVELFEKLIFFLFGWGCDFGLTCDKIQNLTEIEETQFVLIHVCSTSLLFVVNGGLLNDGPEPLDVLGQLSDFIHVLCD